MTVAMFDPGTRPIFSPVYIPSLPTLGLSEAERAMIAKLQMRAWRHRQSMELCDAYYRGQQIMTSLGIAIPPELEFLRIIVGWGKAAVDPFTERLSNDGFLLHGQTESDDELGYVWDYNGMGAEQSLAFTDALVMRNAWLTVGTNPVAGDPPLMCVESPLNMSASWDVRSAKPTELLQSYWLDDRPHAALYLPDQTIHIGQDDNRTWQLTGRDQHGLGFIPAVRMPNQPRSNQRDGASEITPELMSIIDGACRTAVRMDIAGEFYSVPQKLILGATEADFQDSNGVRKPAWSTYISRVLALTRDDDGNVPEVKQFEQHDPSVFTKELEWFASQAAGIMGANPQDLGLYTQGNPVSADASQQVDARRDRRARMKQRTFEPRLVEHMQIAVRFMNNGALPGKYERMSCDWMDPAILNFTGMADGMSKLASEGTVPARSNVVLKKLGFTPAQRAQMAIEFKQDEDSQILRELASSVQAKDARTDLAVATDISGKQQIAPATAAPAPSVQPAAK